MDTIKTTSVFAVITLAFALAGSGCESEVIEDADGLDVTQLHNPCTYDVVGYRDADTGDLYFESGRIVRADDVITVDDGELDEASFECGPSGTAPKQFCWIMSEGSVGCYGCVRGLFVFEYCWDEML